MGVHNKIRLLQANIRSIVPKISELSNFMNIKNFDFALCSETWEKVGQNINFGRNYAYHSQPRNDGYGGVAVIYHTSFTVKKIDTSSFRAIEVVGIEILNLSRKLHIFSIYIPPNSRFSEADISQELKVLCDQMNKLGNSILAGDFNAHNEVYGDARTDQRGATVEEIFDEAQLVVVNNGSSTMIPRPGVQKSVIDLTAVTAELAVDTFWNIMEEDSVRSDHYPICIEVENMKNQFDPATKTIRFLHKQEFTEAWNLIDPDSIDSAEDFYTEWERIKLQTYKSKTVPFKKFQAKRWWNKDTAAKYHAVKKNLRGLSSRITMEQLNNLKTAELRFKNSIKRRKKKAEEDFVTSLNPNTPIDQIFRKVKCFLSNTNITAIQPGQELSKEILKLNAKSIDQSEDRRLQVERPFNFLEREIELHEIRNMMTRLRNKKSAPGLDDLSYKMMSEIPIDILQNLLNAVWTTLKVPAQWFNIILKPILKKNKDALIASSWRPIGMQQCTAKMMSSIIRNRLESHICRYKLLPELSFGFREGMSTKDALLFTHETITYWKTRGKEVAIVVTDMSKAYDSVRIDLLFKMMDTMKFPPHLIRLLEAMTKERKYIIGNFEARSDVGLTQGDPTSPLLFNIYTRQLHKITNICIKLVQFADDIMLIIWADSIQELHDRIKYAVDWLNYNLQDINLTLNIGKCAVLPVVENNQHFEDLKDNLTVTVDGEKIRISKVERILGVQMDSLCNFDAHIIKLLKDIKLRANIFNVFARNKTGAHPKTLLILYKSLVRSKIDYGLELYVNGSTKLLRKLDTAQNRFIRHALGCMMSTPIKSLEAESCIEPLEIRRRSILRKTSIKILSNCEHPLYNSLKSFITGNMDRGATVLQQTISRDNNKLKRLFEWSPNRFLDKSMPNTLAIQIHTSDSIPGLTTKSVPNNKILQQLTYKMIDERYKYAYKIFTDGSKSPTGTGSGFYDPQIDSKGGAKIPNECSIVTAELFAIFQALRHIVQIGIQYKTVILTDSKTAVQKIHNISNMSKNYIVRLIHEIIQKHNLYITIQWIPGHAEINGNEKADEIAKENASHGTWTNIKMTIEDAFANEKEEARQEWAERYAQRESEKGMKLKEIEPRLLEKPFFWKLNLERNIITNLVRLRTGHFNSNQHKAKLKMQDDNLCESCGVVDDRQHIIFDCTRYHPHRTGITELQNGRTNLKRILNGKDMRPIVEFLKKAKPNI